MRNFFFILLVFGLITLFCHCSFDIANNQRILVTGRFKDYSGNPIPGIEVSNVSQHNILGRSLSDNNGAGTAYSIIPGIKYRIGRKLCITFDLEYRIERLEIDAPIINGRDLSKNQLLLPTLGIVLF